MSCAGVVKFHFPSHRRLWAVGLLLCIGTASVFFMTRRRADSIEWLTKSPVQRRLLSFAGPWTQPVKIQLSRLKHWMFGPRQTIAIHGLIFELSPSAISNWTLRTTAFTNSAGECAFVAEDFHQANLAANFAGQPSFKVLSRPSVVTADGMQAQIASYETVAIGTATNVQKGNVGWWVDVWPRAIGSSTELACFVTQTESVFERSSPPDSEITRVAFIRTNLSAGARVRIPENRSLFLLSPAIKTNGSAMGILLTPVVQKRPGR